jgi:ribosomal protein L15E
MLEYRIIYRDKNGLVIVRQNLESLDAAVSALDWKTKDQETRLASGKLHEKPRKFVVEQREVTEWREV